MEKTSEMNSPFSNFMRHTIIRQRESSGNTIPIRFQARIPNINMEYIKNQIITRQSALVSYRQNKQIQRDNHISLPFKFCTQHKNTKSLLTFSTNRKIVHYLLCFTNNIKRTPNQPLHFILQTT